MEFSGLTKNRAGGGRETGNQFGVALANGKTNPQKVNDAITK